MKKSISVLFLLTLSWSISAQSTLDFMEGRLIFKWKSQLDKSSSQSKLEQTLEGIGNWSATEKFPAHRNNTVKSTSKNTVKLDLIHELIFAKNINPLILSKKLMSSGLFEYVEPVYLPKLTYVPNDTLNNQQYYLDMIEAYQAWNINKGDTNVVIGIVDTGVDIDHPDLVDNLFYNYSDPINGIDDDNDGYVDNFLGWDTGNNDNDVSLSHFHGVNVAGIASASTDNTTGISGVGFSCKILPVRIDDAVGRLVGAYEGIVYAADHGADIINNSWGGYQASEFNQDVINYATSKGVLVVSAVGNDSTERPFYPAAYDNVLSVGASEQQDLKKGTSNYGHWVDVFAPGEAMFTLNSTGGYQYNGGTSMASPVVAGVAALVKSEFPNYSPKQIAHKIMSCADNIDQINIPAYSGKLGTGRVNAFRALTENFHPGIEMHEIILSGSLNGVISIGDTIQLSAKYTNYLSPAPNVSIQISGNSNYFEFLKGSISLGLLDSLQTKDNHSEPFLLKVKSGTPINTETELKITIQSGNYTTFEYIDFLLNPDFININHNLIATTLTSTGKIGYNDFSHEEGLGFRYKNGNSQLFEASFMLGNGPNSVADMFRSEGVSPDQDFQRIAKIHPIPAQKAQFEYQTTFSDANQGLPLGLEIIQQNFIFDTSSLNNQIFFVYRIKNTSNQSVANLYAGLISDWDILNYSHNKVIYDAQRKMGISYSTDSNLYLGIKLLSKQNVKHYAIDNFNSGNGGVDIGNGFSDVEKFHVLSNMRDSAGNASPQGNDILDVVSAGPVDLLPDSSVSYAFVLLAAESLIELQNSADQAQQIFNELALSIDEPKVIQSSSMQIAPNPAKESLRIKFTLEDKQSCSLAVYDANGQLVFDEDYGHLGKYEHEKSIPLAKFRSGVYFLELLVGNKKIQDKFVVLK